MTVYRWTLGVISSFCSLFPCSGKAAGARKRLKGESEILGSPEDLGSPKTSHVSPAP